MPQTSTKRIQDKVWLYREGDLMEIVQEFDHTTKWYMQKPVLVLENETHEILCDFESQIDDLILTRKLDQVILNQKKKKKKSTVVPADHYVKIEEKEKRDNYLDPARVIKGYGEWKLLILIIIGVSQWLGKENKRIKLLGPCKSNKRLWGVKVTDTYHHWCFPMAW